MHLAAPLTLLTGLAILAGPDTAPAETAYGTYQCKAERAVGLQGDAASAQRYSGRVGLRAAEQGFTITIDRTEVGRGKRCKTARPGSEDSPVGDEYSRWWFCKATTELTFSPGKYAEPLRGDDRHIFRDRLSGWLHLAEDLRYVFAYTDFAGNFFLEEGTCRAN